MNQFCNEEVQDIERKINKKPKQDKDINECLDNSKKKLYILLLG